MSMREKIARAIDPSAFKLWQASYDYEMRQSGDAEEAKAFADWAHSTKPAFDQADAVLDALMDPTEEVLEASWVRTQRVDPDHRMAVLLADPKAAHLHKMLHRWRAMIRAAKDGK